VTSNAPRRIITGHDGKGRRVVISDGPTPTSLPLPTGAAFYEM
jgi:hypothetical protein